MCLVSTQNKAQNRREICLYPASQMHKKSVNFKLNSIKYMYMDTYK